MPEFNKGFIPFSYVDEHKKYDDEVGNDYDPKGWNTASAMTNKECTVTANNGEDEFTVIHAKVDERVNWAGFKDGIWNKIKCDCDGGGSGPYVAPTIKEIEVSVPDVVNIDKTTITDFNTIVKMEKGTEPIDYVTFELESNGITIVKQTVDKPKGDLKFEVDDDTMKQLVESGASEFTVKVTTSDGTQIVTEEKTIFLSHQILFGVTYTNVNTDAAKIIETLTDKEKIQTLTIAYNKKKFILRSFYPTDDWAYMFIAIPMNFGKITHILNGASYEIGPNEWKPSVCKINNIDYNLYVLQYNNEGTFEFVVTIDE